MLFKRTISQFRKKDEAVYPLSSRTDFLSQETAFYHMGLPDDSSIERVVDWNDGSRLSLEDVQPEQLLKITKP